MTRRIFLFVVLLGALIQASGPVYAQYECGAGTNTPLVPFASETVDVSTTAIGFTRATYCPSDGLGCAVSAYFQVVGANARVYYDGTTPTSSAGYVLEDKTFQTVCNATIGRTNFIRDDGTDLKVFVTYSRAAGQ